MVRRSDKKGIGNLFKKGTTGYRATKTNKVLPSSSMSEVGREIESPGYVRSFLKDKDRFVPNVDYTNPANFARFGSAREYYTKAIENIYRFYPYDGSQKEKLDWHNSASYFDNYIFENEYPRTNGYIEIGHAWGSTSATVDGTAFGDVVYKKSSAPQYISIKGGPNGPAIPAYASGSGYEKPISYKFKEQKANVYDAEIRQQQNLTIDGTTGNTVEFWLKLQTEPSKSQASPGHAYFDIWNESFEYTPGSSQTFGRLLVESIFDVDGSGNPNGAYLGDNIFYVTYASGSSGVFRAGLGSTALSGTLGIDLSNWNHYSFVMKNDPTGSNLSLKLYINGNLAETVITGSQIGSVDTLPLNANIGAYRTAPTPGLYFSGMTTDGWGTLSGSYMDEFRFWKSSRTSQQIRRYWFTQVGGGTNSDYGNTDSKFTGSENPVDLGVYYKFNEGITTTSSLDAVALDYSGRISNGIIKNYSTGMRSTGSAMVLSNAAEREFKDPIVYSNHPNVVMYEEEASNKGREYDGRNSSFMFNTLPGWIIDQDEDRQRNTTLALTQIMSSYFDELSLQIKSLPHLKDKVYLSGSVSGSTNKPLPFADRLLKSHGFIAPEIFADADLLESLANRDDNREFEKKLSDIKNQIYTNIYNNLLFINKSKGTEKAIRNLIRCYGVDDDLYSLNMYADNGVIKLSESARPKVIRKTYADFNSILNFDATVYQHPDPSNSDSVSYITGSTDPSLDGFDSQTGMTLEAEVIFPKKPLADSPGFLDKAFVGLSASLFGIHSAVEDSTDYAWANNDYANFQVYAVRSSETYPSNRDVHFVLSSSNVNTSTEGIFTKIVTDVYKEVYENQKWNFAVKVKPSNYPNIGKISGSLDGTAGYNVEFFGVCTFGNQVIHQFSHTESISQANGFEFATNRKRVYVGSHRTNFTGSLLTKTDVKLSSCRYWSIPLENQEIVSHAVDPKNFGVFNSMESSYLLQTAPTYPKDIAKINTLALHWDFDTVTGSDSNGQFTVLDFSSGSNDGRYGTEFSDLLLKHHTGRGDFFKPSSETAVSREYVQGYRQQVPENLNSYTSVNILSRDDELFTTRTKPIKFTYSVEKSMYQTISEEMINFMAAASDASALENLIGDPVNKYRPNYKALEKVRGIFFERVGNTPDLDKYLDYFKWLDSAVSEMIEKLAPASSRINEVANVVESHLFERGGKYSHKFPTMHFGSNDPIGTIKGINELVYDWEFGHAPLNPSADTTSATGTITFTSDTDSDYDAIQVQILSANGGLPADGDTYLFDSDGTAGATGTVISGVYIIVQVNGMTTKSQIAQEFQNAINHANGHNQGTANSVITVSESGGVLALTQNTVGPSGNTAITVIDYFHGGDKIISTGFSGGLESNQDQNCFWWNKRATRDDANLDTGNQGVDLDRAMIHSASIQVFNRKLNAPYRITAQEGGGALKTKINIREVVSTETPPLNNNKGLNFNSATFLSSSSCLDLDKINPQRKYETDYQVTFRDNNTSMLPGKLLGNYNFISSSINANSPLIPDGYIVDTQHLRDYYNINKDVPLQGPFTEQHVGGSAYRHTGLNIGVVTERPEKYVVNTSIDSDGNIQYSVVNPSFNDVNAPRADYRRDLVSKSPVNIKNIQTNTSSIQDEYGALVPHGNFVNNYEVVQIPGRDINNRYLAENGGVDTTFSASPVVLGLEDYAVPDRGRHASIIANRFSAPGGPEVNSPGYLDAESETFSVYNALPFRNLSVRQPLKTLLTRHSAFGGYDSVYGDPSASYQKTQRNGAKRILSSSAGPRVDNSGFSTASVYDNYWVQHAIPQSDLQYAWITASAVSAPFGYSEPDFTNASQASTDILFVTESQHAAILSGFGGATYSHLFGLSEQAEYSNEGRTPVDFVGLNSIVLTDLTSSDNTVGASLNTDFVKDGFVFEPSFTFSKKGRIGRSSFLNAINLNRNGAGGFSSWKQVRQSYNPLVRHMNKTNNINFVTENNVIEPGTGKNVTIKTINSYTESPVSFKFKPLEHQFVLKTGDTINIQSSYSNNLFTFNNPDIVAKLNIGPVKLDKAYLIKSGIGQMYDDLKALYLYQMMDPDFTPFAIDKYGANKLEYLKYSEDIYPAGGNVGLAKVRGRQNYTVSTGSENFEMQLGKSIAFWKDNINDRLRTNGVAVNAQGSTIYSGSSYFGISDLSIWPLDAEEPFFDLEHHSASGDAAYHALQQGFDPWYFSPLGASGSQLNPAVDPRWKNVTKNGELSYAGWIYNLLNIQIQGKVRFDNTAGSAAPTASGPLEVKTYYRMAKPTASFQFEYPNMIWSGSNAYYPAGGVRLSSSLHLIPPYRTDVLSGRSPWFNSYEDYAQDIRSFGKEYSVLPEFRISEHIDYYLDKGIKAINKKYATLVGASTEITASADGEELFSAFNKDFIETYQMSDFMRHFKLIKEDHNIEVGGKVEGVQTGPGTFETQTLTRKAAKFSTIKLECEGIKKLLPYQGFYPALRAVQLGHLFSASYAPYITGSNSRDGDMERLAALYQPFFAPGVFFNTIKSGIAVDYAVHTGSQPAVSVTDFRVTSPFSGALFPFNQFDEGPNYVLPFESIINPDRFLPISSSEIGPDTSVPSASIYFAYPHFSGTCNTIYNQNFYARDPLAGSPLETEIPNLRAFQGLGGFGAASGSGAQPIYFEWKGQSNAKYSLAANNFFAEVENFFLEKKGPTSFVSSPERNFKTMTSGSSYYMDVVLYKTDDFISYEGPSGSFQYNPYGGSDPGSIVKNLLGDGKFGANPNPVSARGIHYGPPYQAEEYPFGLLGTGSAWYEDPSFAIHTPPYFYGDAIARIEFKPHEARDMAPGDGTNPPESAKFTLQEILANAKVNTSYRNINQRAKALQNDDYRNTYPAGISQMQISSSVNLFGQVTLKEMQYSSQKDAQGNFIPDNATTPVLQDSQDAWVVETKFECPSINLYDMDVASLGAGIGLGREKYYTKGIWKGYGQPASGSAGIFLQLKESFGPKTYAVGKSSDFNPSAKVPRTGSLIDVCGFKADQQRVGEIASAREISEAIVAIPVDGKGMPFNIDIGAYKQQITNMTQGKPPVTAGSFGGIQNDIQETSISRMYNLMKKYYIPPDMDFSQDDNFSQMQMKPFVMYIFEFTHTLTKQDLSNIWQNVMPDISIKAEKQKSVFEHEIGKPWEFFGTLGQEGFPDNVRWKVFKVKKRARNNYFNITKTSEVGKGFAFSSKAELEVFGSNPESELRFSYNWPYDFCSLVELAKVNSEVTFEPEE